jgi:Acetyltransferase (GNAT) domain
MTARSKGGTCWLANAECDFSSINIAGSTQPISVPLANKRGQSYVLSPRSAWIDYAKEEAVRHVTPHFSLLTKISAACAFGPVSLLLHACGLDSAAIIGNRLISTNLYPDWQQSDIQRMNEELIAHYPKKPLVMRNICPDVTPHLAVALQKAGWQLIPARMVYLCDPQQSAVWKHNHIKQDAKLLASAEFELRRPDQMTAAELPELRALYRQLFIEKHSRLNPDFTLAFFELCLESGFLDLYGLRLQGKLVGVLGLYEQNGWITTPLIGYDTSLPQEKGIYRCLMALLLNQARERKLRLHYSSGASQFKRARGGSASLEYTAVLSQHLPPAKRLANRLFAHSMQKFAPTILRKADRL